MFEPMSYSRDLYNFYAMLKLICQKNDCISTKCVAKDQNATAYMTDA